MLCHGVFDILHIGHIRYIEQARKLGQTVVISVTRDEFVHKGPGRPYFSLADRLLQLAALASVDYVVESPAESAVEIIRKIKPDFYCKGVEYQTKDPAGNLLAEKNEVERCGGHLAFIDTEKESSTSLYFSNFAQAGAISAVVQDFRGKYKRNDINQHLEKIRGLKVNIVGETIVDTYVSCWVENVSSKSPSLSGRYLNQQRYLGGVGAVLKLLNSLGCDVTLYTQWDDAQEKFLAESGLFDAHRVVRMREKTVSAPEKTRYIHANNNQRLFELVDLGVAPSQQPKNGILVDCQSDLTLVFDFGHGLIDDECRRGLLNSTAKLWVNAQTNSENYGYNLATKYVGSQNFILDRREASLAVGVRNLDEYTLYDALEEKLSPKGVLCLTLGKNGCMVRDSETKELIVLPALAENSKDAMGAGDAFFAIFSTIMHVSGDCRLAGFLASLFAAEKVKVIGHDPERTVAGFSRAVAHIFTD